MSGTDLWNMDCLGLILWVHFFLGQISWVLFFWHVFWVFDFDCDIFSRIWILLGTGSVSLSLCVVDFVGLILSGFCYCYYYSYL